MCDRSVSLLSAVVSSHRLWAGRYRAAITLFHGLSADAGLLQRRITSLVSHVCKSLGNIVALKSVRLDRQRLRYLWNRVKSMVVRKLRSGEATAVRIRTPQSFQKFWLAETYVALLQRLGKRKRLLGKQRTVTCD